MKSKGWVSVSVLLFFSVGFILKLALFSMQSVTGSLHPPLINPSRNKYFSPPPWPRFQQKSWTWLPFWTNHWEEVEGWAMLISSWAGEKVSPTQTTYTKDREVMGPQGKTVGRLNTGIKQQMSPVFLNTPSNLIPPRPGSCLPSA